MISNKTLWFVVCFLVSYPSTFTGSEETKKFSSIKKNCTAYPSLFYSHENPKSCSRVKLPACAPLSWEQQHFIQCNLIKFGHHFQFYKTEYREVTRYFWGRESGQCSTMRQSWGAACRHRHRRCSQRAWAREPWKLSRIHLYIIARTNVKSIGTWFYSKSNGNLN